MLSLCVCVCVRHAHMCTHTYLEVKEGSRPFYLGERESFQLTHQARKSLFKHCLVAALLLRSLRAEGRGHVHPACLPCLVLTPGTCDFVII